VQLQRRELILARRRRIWNIYRQALQPLAQVGLLTLPHIPPGAASNYHIFHLLTRTPQKQERLLRRLKEHGVPASFHYVPLHTSPYGRALCGEPVSLPVTEQAAATLVRLPLGAHLTGEQAEYVVDAVVEFYARNDE